MPRPGSGSRGCPGSGSGSRGCPGPSPGSRGMLPPPHRRLWIPTNRLRPQPRRLIPTHRPLPWQTRNAGRVENASGGFSYVLPAGWEVADASRLSYGQALLLKQTGPAPLPGQPAPTANDTSILLGRLDLKLFAGAEADNTKAAIDWPRTWASSSCPSRIPHQPADHPAAGRRHARVGVVHTVKFTDTAKPNGQIWAGVVGTPAPSATNPPTGGSWCGWEPPRIPSTPLPPGAGRVDPALHASAAAARAGTRPQRPGGSAAPGDRVGVPIPVVTPVPEMMPPA